MAQKYPGIPQPLAEVNSLQNTAQATKEAVEIVTRQRGDRSLSAVTWQDLLALGLITPDKIPPTPSSGQ